MKKKTYILLGAAILLMFAALYFAYKDGSESEPEDFDEEPVRPAPKPKKEKEPVNNASEEVKEKEVVIEGGATNE